MIFLKVDFAYAFDYLSILEIKKDKFPDQTAAWEDCVENISAQLLNYKEVINSKEYKKLKQSNLLTFEAVDKARNGGKITAKEVDDFNLLRYTSKVNLQSAFFKDKLVEFKN